MLGEEVCMLNVQFSWKNYNNLHFGMFLILQMNAIFIMDPNGSLRVILHCHINMDYGALIRVDFRFLGLLIRVSWLLTHTIISHYSPCEVIFIPHSLFP